MSLTSDLFFSWLLRLVAATLKLQFRSSRFCTLFLPFSRCLLTPSMICCCLGGPFHLCSSFFTLELNSHNHPLLLPLSFVFSLFEQMAKQADLFLLSGFLDRAQWVLDSESRLCSAWLEKPNKGREEEAKLKRCGERCLDGKCLQRVFFSLQGTVGQHGVQGHGVPAFQTYAAPRAPGVQL